MRMTYLTPSIFAMSKVLVVLIKEHAKFKTETASQGKDFVPGSQHESPFIEI